MVSTLQDLVCNYAGRTITFILVTVIVLLIGWGVGYNLGATLVVGLILGFLAPHFICALPEGSEQQGRR
jgi:preprotein translocase subunit SecF